MLRPGKGLESDTRQGSDKGVCLQGAADNPGQHHLHGVGADQEAFTMSHPALPLRGVGAHHAGNTGL